MQKRARIALAALAILALGGLARSEYSPIRAIMGPNSSTISNVACWGDIFGLSLTDCGAFPVIPNTNVGTVATNAALKALTGGLYSTVVRTGYNAANDTPTASYTWNAGSACTDDGGSCIQPNVGSGRWILVPPNGPIPAGIFGAVCVNAGNDQPALQAALNYAQAASPAGRTLRISGNCILNAPLVATSNVTIEGDQMDSTFLSMSSTGIICINFNPSAAFKTLDIRNITCTYASLTNSGVPGISYGNDTYNNIGGRIDSVNVTNGSGGIYCNNCINVVMSRLQISPFYFYGVRLSNVLGPDTGGNVIHDSYIQSFAPPSTGTVGVQWESGGAFDVHDNQIFAPTPIYLHTQGQTSELHIHHNLFTGTGTTTAGIEFDVTSAAFTCTQSGTNMTVTGVTGTIVAGSLTALGQTVSGTGVAAGTTIVSQTSGTPGGAGVYVTSLVGTASAAACRATFIMTELIIDGNIFDSTTRPLYVPQNTGGQFNYNMTFSNNVTNDSATAVNAVTVYNTLGLAIANNLFKCSNTCAGRTMLIDSSVDKATIWQPNSARVGSWGAADIISSTNTCGMLGNALVTTC